jgi:hypothetical protein
MNKLIKFLVMILVLCSCICIIEINADTHTAASCSQADVQAAIDAASDGDTVEVPAGTSTWTTTTSLTPAVTLDKKAITLIGAGIDKTIIYDATNNGWKECALYVDGVEGKPFRVSGFTFYLNDPDCTHGILNVVGNCKNLRIDHCKFDHVTGSGRAITVNGYGVIDHCTIVCPENTTIQGISPAGENDASWVKPFALGTSNALFIEDCNFDFSYMNDNCIDANSGADYVFRYNTVTNTFPGHHGTDSGGGHRAPHSFEIYGNTLTTTIAVYTCGRYRGGTGVVFNNTFSGPYQSSLIASSYRSCGSYAPWGKCDGTSSYDGNTPGMNGYPCLDQIGYATLIEGTTYQPQKSEPLYEWNNTLNGADLDIAVDNMCPEVADHIKANRDYYNDIPKPGYTPYTYPHPLVTGEDPPPPDTTPPSDITSVKDGTGTDMDSTSLATELSANWTPSTDGESNISKYWYAIGDTPGSTGVVEWTSTSNGTVTSVTRSSLLLTVGVTYYFTVKAENGVSLQSNPTSSDGQFVVGGGTGEEPPDEDEINVKAYPNPGSGGNQITFSVNGTTGGEVKIYTISGKLVKKLLMGEGESEVNWDVLNEEGNSIKAGLYIYTITDAVGNKKTGKLVISK